MQDYFIKVIVLFISLLIILVVYLGVTFENQTDNLESQIDVNNSEESHFDTDIDTTSHEEKSKSRIIYADFENEVINLDDGLKYDHYTLYFKDLGVHDVSLEISNNDIYIKDHKRKDKVIKILNVLVAENVGVKIVFIDYELHIQDLIQLLNENITLDDTNIIIGSPLSNEVSGSQDNDIIFGNSENDELLGFSGNDILVGSSGNDYLQGAEGNDTYILIDSNGSDYISQSYSDENDCDTVIIKSLLSSDVEFVSSGKNLLIKSLDSSNVVLEIGSYFKSSNCIDIIEFSDKSYSITDIYDQLGFIIGSSEGDVLNGSHCDGRIFGEDGNDTLIGGIGNDIIVGGDGKDYLTGGLGDDNLYGSSGDDILVASKNNDYLRGEEGNDTYLFEDEFDYTEINQGFSGEDDCDIIQFESYQVHEVIFIDRGTDLRIKSTSVDGGTIDIIDFFTENNRINKIQFTNHTISVDEIKHLISNNHVSEFIIGTSLSEFIISEGNHKYIELGDGNDYLVAHNNIDIVTGNGDNTILLLAHQNEDIIIQENEPVGGKDKIIMEHDYNDTIFRMEGKDLIVSFVASDYKLRVQNFFDKNLNKVSDFHFNKSIDNVYKITNHYRGSDSDQISSDHIETLIDGMAVIEDKYSLTWEDLLIIENEDARILYNRVFTRGE